MLTTYTYVLGWLLAPLLALGLNVFARRHRVAILQTWGIYAVFLLPLVVFSVLNTGTLGARFSAVSYLAPDSLLGDTLLKFFTRYLGNLNLRDLLITGDPILRHHVPGMGSVLARRPSWPPWAAPSSFVAVTAARGGPSCCTAWPFHSYPLR